MRCCLHWCGILATESLTDSMAYFLIKIDCNYVKTWRLFRISVFFHDGQSIFEYLKLNSQNLMITSKQKVTYGKVHQHHHRPPWYSFLFFLLLLTKPASRTRQQLHHPFPWFMMPGKPILLSSLCLDFHSRLLLFQKFLNLFDFTLTIDMGMLCVLLFLFKFSDFSLPSQFGVWLEETGLCAWSCLIPQVKKKVYKKCKNY